MNEPLDAVTAKDLDALSANDLANATDEALRLLWLYGQQAASRAARLEIKRRKQTAAHALAEAAACTCVFSCADDPATRCSLSGQFHVHPDDGTGVFGPCPVHPDAPGDL